MPSVMRCPVSSAVLARKVRAAPGSSRERRGTIHTLAIAPGGDEAAVVGDIINNAGSDLICYRAEAPKALAKAQSAKWDKVLAFAREQLDAPLVLAEGVVHVAQPEASLAKIRRAIEGLDAFQLTALHVLTALTGSALLAIAVLRGEVSAEDAWAAAHVDEDYQIGRGGEDREAAERRAHRWRDFAAAAEMLAILRS